ncbi:MAG: tol-pal system YbgF family protein, partial [bacterium]
MKTILSRQNITPNQPFALRLFRSFSFGLAGYLLLISNPLWAAAPPSSELGLNIPEVVIKGEFQEGLIRPQRLGKTGELQSIEIKKTTDMGKKSLTVPGEVSGSKKAIMPEEPSSFCFGNPFAVFFSRMVMRDKGYFESAQKTFLSRNYSKAAAEFAEMIHRFPDSPLLGDAYFWLAESYHKQGMEEEALQNYLNSGKKNPEGGLAGEAYYSRSWILFQQKQYKKAVDDLQVVTARYPKSSRASLCQYLLGEAFYRLKSYAQATGEYRKFIESYPRHSFVANSRYWLAESLYNSGKYKGALKEYKLFLADYPKHILSDYALYGAGWSNYKLHQYTQSVKYFKRLYQGFP